MATDAVFAPASGQQTPYRPVNRTAERGFFSGMAILLCICVFIGFSPTYFQAGMMRAPLPSPILHVHSPDVVVMTHRGTTKGMQNGKEVTESHRSLHVFQKLDGRWQVVANAQLPIAQ